MQPGSSNSYKLFSEITRITLKMTAYKDTTLKRHGKPYLKGAARDEGVLIWVKRSVVKIEPHRDCNTRVRRTFYGPCRPIAFVPWPLSHTASPATSPVPHSEANNVWGLRLRNCIYICMQGKDREVPAPVPYDVSDLLKADRASLVCKKYLVDHLEN
jgi:hypothetical protein